MQLKFDKNKKVKILIIYLGYHGMVKKAISRYCPFKGTYIAFTVALGFLQSTSHASTLVWS